MSQAVSPATRLLEAVRRTIADAAPRNLTLTGLLHHFAHVHGVTWAEFSNNAAFRCFVRAHAVAGFLRTLSNGGTWHDPWVMNGQRDGPGLDEAIRPYRTGRVAFASHPAEEEEEEEQEQEEEKANAGNDGATPSEATRLLRAVRHALALADPSNRGVTFAQLSCNVFRRAHDGVTWNAMTRGASLKYFLSAHTRSGDFTMSDAATFDRRVIRRGSHTSVYGLPNSVVCHRPEYPSLAASQSSLAQKRGIVRDFFELHVPFGDFLADIARQFKAVHSDRDALALVMQTYPSDFSTTQPHHPDGPFVCLARDADEDEAEDEDLPSEPSKPPPPPPPPPPPQPPAIVTIASVRTLLTTLSERRATVFDLARRLGVDTRALHVFVVDCATYGAFHLLEPSHQPGSDEKDVVVCDGPAAVATVVVAAASPSSSSFATTTAAAAATTAINVMSESALVDKLKHVILTLSPERGVRATMIGVAFERLNRCTWAHACGDATLDIRQFINWHCGGSNPAFRMAYDSRGSLVCVCSATSPPSSM
jgi:hypothetical protein